MYCTGIFYGRAGNKTLQLWDELLGETALIQDGPPWGGSGALMPEGFLKIAHMGEKEPEDGVMPQPQRGELESPSVPQGPGWAWHRHWDNSPWRTPVSIGGLRTVLYNSAMPTSPWDHLSSQWCKYKFSLQCGRSAAKNSHAGDWEHKNFLFSLNLSVKMSDTVLTGFWTALITKSWKAVLEGEIWVF